MNPGTLAWAIVEMRRLRMLAESPRHGGTQSNVRSKARIEARSELYRLCRIYLPALLDLEGGKRALELELALRKVLEAHPHKVGYEIEEARALGAAESVLKGELGIDAWEYMIRSQCAQICEDRAAMLATDCGERGAGDYIEAAVEAERCADAILDSAARAIWALTDGGAGPY